MSMKRPLVLAIVFAVVLVLVAMVSRVHMNGQGMTVSVPNDQTAKRPWLAPPPPEETVSDYRGEAARAWSPASVPQEEEEEGLHTHDSAGRVRRPRPCALIRKGFVITHSGEMLRLLACSPECLQYEHPD